MGGVTKIGFPLFSVFPDLEEDPNFKVLSEPSDTYNCIAWAMQFADRWVDTCKYPGHWWPEGTERSMSTEALIQAFKAVGFNVAENGIPEPGFDKVVLYKRKNVDEWTHAARIISDTVEHSKFGSMWDCTHSHDVLHNTSAGCEDLSYGVAYAYMKRPVACHTEDKQLSGSFTADKNLLQKFISNSKD